MRSDGPVARPILGLGRYSARRGPRPLLGPSWASPLRGHRAPARPMLQIAPGDLLGPTASRCPKSLPAILSRKAAGCRLCANLKDTEFVDGGHSAGAVRPSLGYVVQREALHLIVLEVHDHPALERAADVAALEVIDVVPAVLVEDILHHRRAEQIAHLAAGHADL